MSGTIDETTTAQSTTDRNANRYVGRRVHGGVRILKYPGKQELTPDRSLDVVSHSPSGFEWGYGGSGPAQLALAILLDYTDDREVARAYHQAFKREVVSQLECAGPDGTWTLTAGEIEQWLPADA